MDDANQLRQYASDGSAIAAIRQVQQQMEELRIKITALLGVGKYEDLRQRSSTVAVRLESALNAIQEYHQAMYVTADQITSGK
jgi:hypothetical protein